MFLRALLIAVVTLVVLNLALIPIYDLGQCTRKCRWEVAGPRGMDDSAVEGERDSWSTCKCLKDGEVVKSGVKRLYDEYPPGFPYSDKNSSVCGVNGVMYPSPSEANRNGVKIINCGPCGDCSTVHDVSIYREYAEPMTRMLSKCAMLYVFFGEASTRICARYMFATPDKPTGLSPKCLNRFIDNYGCTLAHCYNECLYKWENPLSSSNNHQGEISHSGKVDGTKLNRCMRCDEVFCSPVFISSGGANRRCSGTVTDIARPEEEVCQHVNAI